MTEYYIINTWRELWTGKSWTKARVFAKSFSYEEAMTVINKRFSTKVRRPSGRKTAKFIILGRPTLIEATFEGHEDE